MPVSKSHGAKCSDSDQYNDRQGGAGSQHNRGHKRPRSQLSNHGPGPGTRSHVTSPQGWESGARPGSWPNLQNILGAGAGPTINIPDSRYGYQSPRGASNRYGQVRSVSDPKLTQIPRCYNDLVTLYPLSAGVKYLLNLCPGEILYCIEYL